MLGGSGVGSKHDYSFLETNTEMYATEDNFVSLLTIKNVEYCAFKKHYKNDPRKSIGIHFNVGLVVK